MLKEEGMASGYSRRWFVGRLRLLGSALALTAVEQRPQSRRPRRIGFLVFYDAPTLVKAFEEEMRRLGYVEGENIVIEKRASRPNTSDLSGQAAELARMDLSLIVAGALPQALEVRRRRSSRRRTAYCREIDRSVLG
jgi:putative ABC transport system substrate-binding protein